MTKKHFIALADFIRDYNLDAESIGQRKFDARQIGLLADFCLQQNGQFNRSRWLGYIAGTNGRNGGKVKHVKVLHGLCNVCGHYGEDCTGKEAA